MNAPAPAKASVFGCGCSFSGPWRGYMTMQGSDGVEHALVVQQDRVLLASDKAATAIVLTRVDMTTFTLSLPSGQGIEAYGQSLRVSDAAGTPFILEHAQGRPELVSLRSKNGLYISGHEPGKPITLSSNAGAHTALRLLDSLTPAAAPAPEPTRRPAVEDYEVAGVPSHPIWHMKFAADPDAWDDPSHSTHLWIFNRARIVILQNLLTSRSGLGRNQSSLRYFLNDDMFVNAVKRGIDAADNTGAFDVATSGIYFSAHFYDPVKKRGGWWDTNPAINALEYGSSYFNKSIADENAEDSGRHLGLAIHYLQDLCQPMHCGLYPNNPLDSGYGWRHENYEQWILGIQSQYALALGELQLDDLNFPNIREWWKFTAEAGYREYSEWLEKEGNYGQGPASYTAYGSTKLTKEEAGKTKHENWLPCMSRMLRLAQRVTTGLMLAWADAPARIVTNVLTSYKTDELLIGNGLHRECIVAGDTADNHVYFQKSEGRSNARWILEPVMKDGQPLFTMCEGRPRPVCRIRDRKHGLYIVAGDAVDNNVYHQRHNDRLNAQWAIEPVVGPDGRPSFATFGKPFDMYHPGRPPLTYPLQRLRDMKHGLYLVAGDAADNHVYHQPHGGRLNAQWLLDSKLDF
jgi:hypothetical protein